MFFSFQLNELGANWRNVQLHCPIRIEKNLQSERTLTPTESLSASNYASRHLLAHLCVFVFVTKQRWDFCGYTFYSYIPPRVKLLKWIDWSLIFVTVASCLRYHVWNWNSSRNDFIDKCNFINSLIVGMRKNCSRKKC